MKLKKIVFLLAAISMFAAVVFSQGTFKPRDADEEHGWRLYNQYKASQKREAELNKRIAQLKSDIQNASHSSIGGLGADPGDVAEKNKALEALKAEQTKQKNLESAWQKKFYWRYGDLKDSDKMIYDPKTKKNMDKIQFALIYFPFNPQNNVDAAPTSAPSTSLTLESPGYWGHLSYTITGARLNPPSGGDQGKVAGRQYTGELAGNTLTVSGTAVSDNPSSGPGSLDYYELKVSVTVGQATKNYSYIAPKGEKLNKSFSLSVPVEKGASGSFGISLLEQNANYGPHGWVVGGSVSPAKAGTITAKPPIPVNVPKPPPVTPKPPPKEEKTIYSTANDYGVLNGGTPPAFLLKVSVSVHYIMTYHWNNGQGTTGGTIALRDTKGKIYGHWKVKVRNRVYWEVTPNIKLPPGTYQVVDSEPSTWAHNPQSGGKGMVIIKGFVL